MSLSARRFEVNRLELTLSIASFAAAIGAVGALCVGHACKVPTFRVDGQSGRQAECTHLGEHVAPRARAEVGNKGQPVRVCMHCSLDALLPASEP